jgi:hypothetical protein
LAGETSTGAAGACDVVKFHIVDHALAPAGFWALTRQKCCVRAASGPMVFDVSISRDESITVVANVLTNDACSW